ncbi:hypothetical protein [Polaromonas naphthalenivorans]|uniref:Uncharacterized protein n=1 Tax=Polaromonas naphthalenivorans (strain CJ2) TaxID=365044 RepID=A1VVC5_POLNA|nr:hypothetical protein [Polaromonas naphthalenivorans]ABM39603.1 hypothetical protein Pnap_4321 [Polaromonas naphthalenivorans CJ2]
METAAVQVSDFFAGTLAYVPTHKQNELKKCAPFGIEEVELMLPSFPEVMVADMELCFQRYRRVKVNKDEVDEDGEFMDKAKYYAENGEMPKSQRKSAASANLFGASKGKATALQKQFYECIAWLFDIYESECRIPFEQACLNLAMEPELIRNTVSAAFSDDIREFILMYSYANPMDAKRVQRCMRGYINFYN